ncbi:MAG: mevalonate kinase [Anaerolineae bacterium]|nr:mevalonate kinase [Anaerolineae bacterium]
MKTVQATAPGKVILFGEHAVVYGRPAIAVPVTQVQATAVLQSAEAGADFRIIATDLNRDYELAQAQADDPLAVIVQTTLQHLEQTHPPAATLQITSTIPLARGMGSGAAVSAAIARALAKFSGHSLPAAEVSALVYEVEKIHHGTPSGIDNTVVTFAQPVYFIKAEPAPKIRRMRVAQPFTLVIGDTGLVSPTHKAVSQVRARRQAEPERYEGYFDEMAVIADQARVAIETGTWDLSALGKLMNENQELLATIGVSSPELERLIQAARQAGAAGAKLSGAGLGGNIIALASSKIAPAVAEALTEAGATGVIVTEVQ